MTILGHALLLVLANGCIFVAGAGVSRALGVWDAPRDLRRSSGIAYVCGLAAFGVGAQLMYVLGFSLRLWQSLLICAALAGSGLSRRGHGTRKLPPRTFGGFEVAAAVCVGLMLLLLGVDALFQPLASWDAWTQWTPKARALVLTNGLNPHFMGSAAYNDWHLDYPLLVPGVEAFAFRFIGLDVRVLHLQQWFFLFGFVVAFIDLLRPRVRPLFLWSVLIAIVWAPKVGNETIAANADLVLAVFLALAGIAAAVWLTEQDRSALGLLALFGAAALATKVEGSYLVAILFLVTIVYTAVRSRPLLGVTLAACAASLVGIVPWRIWTAAHHLPVTYSIHDALAGPGWHDRSRVPISTLVVVGQLFSPKAWMLLVPLSLAAVAALVRSAAPTRQARVILAAVVVLVGVALVSSLVVPGPSFPFPWRSSDWLLFAPVVAASLVFVGATLRVGGLATWSLGAGAAMIATFVAVYIVTPYPFAWHLGTSSARVVLGPALFLAALVPVLLERAANRVAS